MRTLLLVPGLVLCAAACGDDGGAADASNVPAMVSITGTATSRGTSSMMLPNVMIGAYRNGNDTTPVATTMSDATGKYTLVVPTDGKALDGYVKATLSSYLDTYLYPPTIVTADLDGASVNMITMDTVDLLANTVCLADQTSATGAIAVIVIDAMENPVMGAMVTSEPAPNKVCYNAGGIPSRQATMTGDDGVAYLFNVTGEATVSATKSGSTFNSHKVNARAGAFTTTLIQP